MTTPDVAARLDPALRRFVTARTDLSPETLPAVRQSLDSRRAEAAAALDTTGVDICGTTARFGRASVGVRIYRGGPAPAPAVVYCHSGAFVLGNLDTDHRQCVEFARRAQCTVISVDYRLAPEHRHPAAFDDVLTVLCWVAAEAVELQVDPSRIAVSGSSAGGALAALLAQTSAAGAAPPLAFQLLHQPVLDDRPTPSRREFATTPGFDGPAVEQMWRHYAPAGADPAAVAPARSADLTGLPAAFVSCSELDPLRDEALHYSQRLLGAGVATELHVSPGTCHGFDSLLPDWEISRQLFALQGAALRRALHR
ncbi:alpha/beta hydrolase [Mycobacterium sp. IS-1742]|uniref:alpha/beta hydrolase n=1 Tax=Mycobacterium sp. IS-1742 TaxID=1772285 RepID=UPI000740339D|nr:alpha/beta hydrolase [Mycobacterium sp. IS-1742]KUI25143.1 alpha/beta hydrolase [Mycobacterium sp. IS-1742]